MGEKKKKEKEKEKNKVHSLTDGIHKVGVCWSCRLNTKPVFSSRKSLGFDTVAHFIVT